jgi:hypothetical protein
MVLEKGADNELHWRYMRNDDVVEKIEYWFHRACFLELAGKKFIANIKEKGVDVHALPEKTTKNP